MFEVGSVRVQQNAEQVAKQKLGHTRKTSKHKAKTRSFDDLVSLVSNWEPSDSAASRRLLTSELQTLMEQREYACVRACIPAIVVDQQFPVDLMHYDADRDIDEFMARVLWMHEEYNHAIAILLGIPDDETAAKVEDA
jgi:hypothetical protein